MPKSLGQYTSQPAADLIYDPFVRKAILSLAGSTLVEPITYTASHVLGASDDNAVVRMNVASANIVTIPLDSTISFSIGTMITVRGVGTGETTITPASGVTLNGSTFTINQYGSAVLHKVDVNEWDIYAGGGAPSLIQLSTPTLTATAAGDTAINLTWNNILHESSYKLEWSANGTSGWTQIGGTIAANTTAYSHTGLTASTHYYYRLSGIGDGATYSDSDYSTDDAITDAPAVGATNIILSSATTNFNNASGVWTVVSGTAGYGNTGIDTTQTLAPGTDGYIELTRSTSGDGNAIIAMDDTSGEEGLANLKWGMFIVPGNGTLAYVDNGAASAVISGYMLGVGEKARIVTNGTGAPTIIVSNNNFASFTTKHTFSQIRGGATIRTKVDFDPAGILSNPKAFGYV